MACADTTGSGAIVVVSGRTGSMLRVSYGVQPGDALKAEIQEHAKRSMAGYKYPRKIEFVAALPKTASGKIKRKELRERERN